MILMLMMSAILMQDPVPPSPHVPVDEVGEGYFAGATADDKAFIDAARESVERSDLNRFQKWRIQRRLSKPAFVAMAKKEIAADVYWDDPEQMKAIDWSQIDWEKILSIILMIIKLLA